MKQQIIKYRSIIVIAMSLIFNLISSLLVWHPEGQIFNTRPLTVTEWVCDIISTIIFFFGFISVFYDINDHSKKKIKEAIIETNDELKNDEDAVVNIKKKED